ncbi:MAG: hypothetical protein P8183_05620 [Anaerolineae bacterium]|jgi:hypothetical protein
MTKQTSRRPNQQLGTLKALLLTGSVVATLAGTKLLAQQAQAAPVVPTAISSVTVVEPATSTNNSSAAIPLPPTISGKQTQVQLQPIPQVVQPRINPVVRSRSSR